MAQFRNKGTRGEFAARDAQQPPSPPGLSVGWKWFISGLVMLQLLAVTSEPFRFFTRSARGTSPAADPVRWALGPYVEFAYLNHGYFFFAPEPGPSHLMQCRLEMPDSSQVSITFPDKRKQWPRLLYHRHFMLAEFLHQLHVPPVDPALVAGDPALDEAWQAERSLFERVRESMSTHVSAKFGARSTTIQRIEHRLPSDDEVFRQRLALDSPSLYIVLPDAPPALGPPPASQLPAWGWQGMGVLLEPQLKVGPAGRPYMDRSLFEVQPIPLRTAPAGAAVEASGAAVEASGAAVEASGVAPEASGARAEASGAAREAASAAAEAGEAVAEESAPAESASSGETAGQLEDSL